MLYATNLTASRIEGAGFASFIFATQTVTATLMARTDIQHGLGRPKRYVAALAAALVILGFTGTWIVTSPSVGQAVGEWVFGFAGIPYLLAPLGGLVCYYIAGVVLSRFPRL
jgi:hypothetical protein